MVKIKCSLCIGNAIIFNMGSESVDSTSSEMAVTIDPEKAKQVSEIKLDLENESGKNNHYKEYGIKVNGIPIGSLSVSTEGPIPRVEAVNIIHPGFTGKGYVTASYMSYTLGNGTDLQKGFNNADSRRIWDSLNRRNLVDNNILRLNRVKRHLGIQEHTEV